MKNRPSIFLYLAVFFLLIIASVISAFIGWKAGRPGVSVDASRAAVIKGVQELGRLETASLTVEKVITAGTDGPAFQDILFGDRILMVAQGTVVAGVNLEGLTKESVRIEDGVLRVTLPAPQVLNVRLDNKQTRVYDRHIGFLTKGDAQLESRARYAAENAIYEAACEADLMAKARESAQKQITKLIQALNIVKDNAGNPSRIESFEVIIPSAECPKWHKPNGWDNFQSPDKEYEDLL